MPTKAVAYRILKDYRDELLALQSTPMTDASGPANLLGIATAPSVLKRMKRPLWQWLTMRQAPADLSGLIEFLDDLAEAAIKVGIPQPTRSPKSVQDVHARRYWAGRWAEDQVTLLLRRILTKSAPADLVADGFRNFDQFLPGWFWRLSPGDGESTEPIVYPLFYREAMNQKFMRGQTEALWRLGSRSGVDFSDDDLFLWFAQLNGLRAHHYGLNDHERRRLQLCFNRLWWAEAAKRQSRAERPAKLPPLIPAQTHDYRHHTVSWLGLNLDAEYRPNVETVVVDLEPSRHDLPIVGDTVRLPRYLTGVIATADYYENNNGYVVRAKLCVLCEER